MDGALHYEYNVEGGDFSRAGYASSQIKKVLKGMNIDPGVIKRAVVACYEAEVNVVAHAYSGAVYFDVESNLIRIVFKDEGPGIEDIELAMTEGFSTASTAVREMGFGAGMGLSNMKRNADRLNIKSEVERGTTVEIIINI